MVVCLCASRWVEHGCVMVQGVDGDFGGVWFWDFDLVSKEMVCVFGLGLSLALGSMGVYGDESLFWLWLEEDEDVNG